MELMIGDWVFYSKKALPYQIKMIGENLCKLNGIDNSVEIGEIHPVLLTEEILKKNGFEKVQIHGEKQDDIFQCFDKEIIIEVGIYDPNFILIRYHYETPDGINSGELLSIIKVDGGMFYLHELQHALRLCGIEKTLEL